MKTVRIVAEATLGAARLKCPTVGSQDPASLSKTPRQIPALPGRSAPLTFSRSCVAPGAPCKNARWRRNPYLPLAPGPHRVTSLPQRPGLD